jgi:hypothetical protein
MNVAQPRLEVHAARVSPVTAGNHAMTANPYPRPNWAAAAPAAPSTAYTIDLVQPRLAMAGSVTAARPFGRLEGLRAQWTLDR